MEPKQSGSGDCDVDNKKAKESKELKEPQSRSSGNVSELSWSCDHCTLENSNQEKTCAACGLPSEVKSACRGKFKTTATEQHGEGPVFAVLMVEDEKLKCARIIALNEANKRVWACSGVRKMEKFSDTELLICTENEGMIVNKDTGEPSVRFDGRIQHVITFSK